MIKSKYWIFGIFLISCTPDVSTPTGVFSMVKSDNEKMYGVGCIPFSILERPFRIRFIDDKQLEFYPGIIKVAEGSTSEYFFGFKAKFKLDRNKLVVRPLQSELDSIIYDVLYSSIDSLVLKDGSGNSEYYKKSQLEDQRRQGSFIWKVEIQASENISSCSPYMLVVDSTGMLSISKRGVRIDRKITPEITTMLFNRINEFKYFELNGQTERESDSRRIHFKAWTNDDIIEFENDPVYFSYELRRLLIIFDDYVYN